MIEEWYAPNEIKYTYRQVKWLLANLIDLRKGIYPPNPEGGSYVDQPISRRQPKSKAPFIDACDIAGELDRRLGLAGIDGLIVEFIYTNQGGYKRLSRATGLSLKEIGERRKKALAYISNPDVWKKRISYADYVIS